MRKDERQQTILNLILARSIGRQDELAKMLRRNGFSVTQASISRDLEELGVVKVNGSYTLPQKASDALAFGLFALETAGENLLVAKCGAGLASAAAVRIDAARIPDIVGTIAGDDTIFIAVKDAKARRSASRALWKLFED
jgi:transcriptional regulator of arginine metabolism